MPLRAADCPAAGAEVRILANDFPALHAVTERLRDCLPGLRLNVNHPKEYRNLQEAALRASPAAYNVIMTGNNSIVPLLEKNLLQPLDALVAEHGQHLLTEQLVRINGDVMAIGLLVNAQQLFYRQDVLEHAGIPVPATMAELISACQRLQQLEVLQYPLAGAWQAGWNLALEFINLYLATGASLFTAGTLQPNLRNDEGIATLELMLAMTGCMRPDYLSQDINSVQAEWEAGTVALASLWGSRGAAVLQAEGARPEVTDNTRFTTLPGFGDGSVAATLWWVGFALPRNIEADEAVAAFQAMMYASDAELLTQHSDEAVWLLPGYQPTATAAAVLETVRKAAPAYPMSATQHLLHAALGNELPDFFLGRQTARETLADIEASYRTRAIESGFSIK